MAAGLNIAGLQLDTAPLAQHDGEQVSFNSRSQMSVSLPSSPTALSLASPEGIDCYGNERQVLSDQAKFYNNTTLSDVTLVVGGNKFYAHKLILVRSSDVFERMLSEEWNDGSKKDLTLTEDSMCVNVFPRFLQFLYSCHVKLNIDNTLPVLILADKYNVTDLRNVCISFACSFIIPKLQLKDVFHVWFQYATKCNNVRLTNSCISAMAEKMDDIIGSVEWEDEWVSMDNQQLIEFLKCSELCIKDEFQLWNAMLKWLLCPQFPSRAGEKIHELTEIVEHIRFPMMTAEQLCAVESTEVAQKYKDIFQKHFLQAYKYHALPLTSRATVKEFTGPCFLLRNYTDLRWDKRFVLQPFSACPKCSEVSFRFSTRASTFPQQTWDWDLKCHPKGFSSTSEEFRCILYSNLILDQPRPIEYLLSVVGKDEILHSVSGRKNFSKTRYTADTEMDKKVSVAELCQPNSPLLVEDSLILQITLKPVE